MTNLIYFLITLAIMIIFFFIDGISHQRFKKTTNLFFHIFGILIVSTSFAILMVKEFNLTLLIYPGAVLIIIGLKLIYLSYIKIKNDFLRANKITWTGIYSKTRHPMYLGLIILFSGISLLTYSLFVLLYSIIAIFFIIWLALYEEKHLIKRFGKKYLKYQKKVPMLLPLK